MHSMLGNYNFGAAFELIRRNYKLIALDNYDDKVKLKGAKRTHSMGDGWTVLDAFHKRYQDEVVAAVKGKLPTVEEYLEIAKNIDTVSEDIYKYLNFNELPKYQDIANEVVLET